MTAFNFSKMHGLGNDFILCSALHEELYFEPDEIRRLCNRRRGIGADGIIVVLPALAEENDYRMQIFNADGSEAQMCGNGIRCFGLYLEREGITDKDKLRIETAAGVRTLYSDGELYTVKMGEPIFRPSEIPIKASGEEVLEQEYKIGEEFFTITALSMGNPHAVIFTPRVEEIPLEEYGPLIERDSLFPQQTNVEFVSLQARDRLRMRVWERGVGVTEACGTGACAAAVAAMATGRAGARVQVILDGGGLEITRQGKEVLMKGPAVFVYSGRVELGVEK